MGKLQLNEGRFKVSLDQSFKLNAEKWNKLKLECQKPTFEVRFLPQQVADGGLQL